MTKKEIKIADRADMIQTEMHKTINTILDSKPETKASYNDIVISFLIKKIAALEVELENQS